MKHTDVRSRQAILTLYGDYALRRNGEIGIGSLITLLDNYGVSEQAIRSTVMRMCRTGILKAKHSDRKSYYSLTDEGRCLLTEGAQRIFQHKNPSWDGRWNIVIYSIPEQKRKARDKFRTDLGWLGYGPLGEATWISPSDLTLEVKKLLQRLSIEEYVHIFSARHEGGIAPEKIVSGCWDLDRIHQKYDDFITKYSPKLEEHIERLQRETVPPNECFTASFSLIDEYRRLPFFDPDLPLELLPGNWLRPAAAALFDKYYGLLSEQANEYFDSVCKDYRTTSKIQKPALALR